MLVIVIINIVYARYFSFDMEQKNPLIWFLYRNLAEAANKLVIERLRQEEEWENVPEVFFYLTLSIRGTHITHRNIRPFLYPVSGRLSGFICRISG